jgi:hypothetical protein
MLRVNGNLATFSGVKSTLEKKDERKLLSDIRLKAKKQTPVDMTNLLILILI